MDISIVSEKIQVTTVETVCANTNYHKLYDKWTLWAHLPHDTDWSLNSYKSISTFESVESGIILCESLPDELIKNCMLFLMREGIKPIWEDERNRLGGCFSYKVSNKSVANTWKQLSYNLIGENLTQNIKGLESINGITISPKKNFCIIKIWLSNCDNQSASIIKEVGCISSYGCLFKKHLPEY